jgi:ParB/RepB/Spo0J family partition protein
MTPPANSGRRGRGGGGLAWLAQEGGGDAALVVREQLQALAGPPVAGEVVQKIPCGHIDRSPYQARRVFPAKAMAALKESIRQNRLLQPVVVRPRPGGRYELIAGERRWRVVQLLGWDTIDAVVRAVDDITAHLLGQIENDQREDVSAWERALGYVDLREHIRQESGTAPHLAELGEMRGGVDKSTVSRYLTIGEAFPPEALIRARITEERMASLSLPTLLRAARRPEAERFALLRDVLRKRRARAAERARAAARRTAPPQDPRPSAPDDGHEPDTRPTPADRRPPAAEADPSIGDNAGSWDRFYAERGIRIETSVPARELTPKQAHAAALRLVPAFAALSARCADTAQPAAIALEGSGGRIVFVPDSAGEAQLAAYQALRVALGV